MPTNKASYQYLSDSHPSYKFLEEKLKLDLIKDLGHFKPVDLLKEQQALEKIATNVLGQYSLSSIEESYKKRITSQHILPTRYDDPVQFITLEGKIAQIKKAAQDIGLNTSDFPLYANIPTGKVNATAIWLEGCNDKFLLFDSLLFNFCHLFSKAFTLCLPFAVINEQIEFSLELEKIEEHIKNNGEGIHRLSELMINYVYDHDPSKSSQYPINLEFFSMASLMREGMELFVVGHEFGHVYAEHLQQIKSFKTTAQKTFSSREIAESHRKELEADYLGLALATQAMANKGNDAGLSVLGAYLFFVALEIAGKVNNYLLRGELDNYSSEPSDTHPSPLQRLEWLKKVAHLITADDPKQKQSLSILAQIDGVENVIWEHLLEHLKKKKILL